MQGLAEFGGGCDKIAHTRALLGAAQQGLGEEVARSAAFGRLRRCAEDCTRVEEVLKDCGLREKLAEAEKRWEQEVKDDPKRENSRASSPKSGGLEGSSR